MVWVRLSRILPETANEALLASFFFIIVAAIFLIIFFPLSIDTVVIWAGFVIFVALTPVAFLFMFTSPWGGQH